MDKTLAMALVLDLETSLKMIAFALEEKKSILAQEALAHAELEVATHSGLDSILICAENTSSIRAKHELSPRL